MKEIGRTLRRNWNCSDSERGWDLPIGGLVSYSTKTRKISASADSAEVGPRICGRGIGILNLSQSDVTTAQELLGYLNFSGGRPDTSFERQLNEFVANVTWSRTREALQKVLFQLHDSTPAFADIIQADSVLRLVYEEVLPAYREHHRDLLAHLVDAEFDQPFFLAKVFEAVLEAGGPWEERDRIVRTAIDRLNDFVGFRPIAVLENGRKMEVYSHERVRPWPLYIRNAGVAHGPYRVLVQRALELMADIPEEMRADANFDFDQLDELALDPRAHDHMHPVNKRTNYLFGEWDPHQIDIRGRYRRFVIRRVIVDSLLDWQSKQKRVSQEEVLFDMAAVLCGTILMASAISGDGPECHDSNVTLTSLLPRVARQRDRFYDWLLQSSTGNRAKRLKKHAKATRQPFGHVRQSLNMYLANYGTQQVQRRQLAHLFARMGYAEASLRQASIIPCASARFECEILCRVHSARRIVERGKIAEAAQLLGDAEQYLHRGIECGAIVDPWNILGFQGLFPLFSSREDSVPDQRVEILLHMMDALLDAYTRTWEEAAARGEEKLAAMISVRYEALAEFWDKYGTSTVSDLPRIAARESLDSASHVAQALSDWRTAGESAGDMQFWRSHVDKFESAKAYAQVVSALLERRDTVAALGLLMQWLSQQEEVGLEAGHMSFEDLLLWWMGIVVEKGSMSKDDPWPLIRRMFDYLEANAGELWSAPASSSILDASKPPKPEPDEDVAEQFGDAEPDEEDELFGAAYEGVVYRDSADDGQEGETMDDRPAFRRETEFELIEKELDPRLKFLRTIAQLWQMASTLAVEREVVPNDSQSNVVRESKKTQAESLRHWLRHSIDVQADLARLIDRLWKQEIGKASAEHDANIEYDTQLQTKLYLLQTAIQTALSCRSAQWCLACALSPADDTVKTNADDVRIIDIYRGVMQRNEEEVRRVLPGLLRSLQSKPLLYVPLEHGGDPKQIVTARSMQMVIRFLLAHLPQLGMLRETWHLLKTARQMERASRPRGMAVTEFDRLFRIALRYTLECVVKSSGDWKGGRFSDEDLIEVVGTIVDKYFDQWLEHSNTMRLSAVEALTVEPLWEETAEFVKTYGSYVLNARFLTLGNVRAILHGGVEHFLEHLEEMEDPLHPIKLLEDLRSGKIDRDDAAEQLNLIYQVVVEKFDRFLEYNTTTTQSDYGEHFYSLLDFLRLETSYDRDAWKMLPVTVAHEVLARLGKPEAAIIWEDVISLRTEEKADGHLAQLESLQKKYGMRMPSVANHLEERFVKPLSVNHMLARIRPACEDAESGRKDSPAFQSLQSAVEDYLKTTSGSGIDVPAWLKNLEEELNRVHESGETAAPDAEPQLHLPIPALSLKELRQQLKQWKQPPSDRKGKA